MTGTATHRDAQLRHALTQLLHWAKATDAAAIAIEDLDFGDSKTREKNGGSGGDRTTRPRTPDQATDGTAPPAPERC